MKKAYVSIAAAVSMALGSFVIAAETKAKEEAKPTTSTAVASAPVKKMPAKKVMHKKMPAKKMMHKKMPAKKMMHEHHNKHHHSMKHHHRHHSMVHHSMNNCHITPQMKERMKDEMYNMMYKMMQQMFHERWMSMEQEAKMHMNKHKMHGLYHTPKEHLKEDRKKNRIMYKEHMLGEASKHLKRAEKDIESGAPVHGQQNVNLAESEINEEER